MKDLLNLYTGKDIPIRSDKSFYELGKKYIIPNKKERRKKEKEEKRKYFGTFKEFTSFCAINMQDVLTPKPKKRKPLNKKGSVFDMVITFSFLFVMVIISGICLFIFSSFNDAWQDNTAVTEISKEASQDHNNRMVNILDGSIIFFFIILWVTSMVSAWFLDSSPIFYVIFGLISILSLVGIAGFAIFADEILTSPAGVLFNDLPMSIFILQNSLWFGVAYFLSVGITLYAKNRG